ncbi:amino acid ABC transporter permease [Paludibacterium paludis]|uniref:Amino acid ABC transporter permease n=1 Tax=Paludibacterium paludis TaxID=1225769 RepID=A0A918U956_9NEIS|nr:amino acid ABC transporter permease [Paludibacterium paludis]GGY12311.1 amino acid ABC transporter permease [Paludibacterium paludis]
MNYHWNWGVYFNPTGVGNEIYLNWFVSGLGWTLAIALCGWLVALSLGAVIGVARTLEGGIASRLAGVYVALFRNVPLLVQLFFWYFLVPDLLPGPIETWFKQDLNPGTSAFISVVVCLGLFTAARVAEQVRTGIEALPRGQRSAGLAIGFTRAQLYRYVLLPQAFRIIIPPLTGEFLNIIKNSSVASLIGLMDLLAQTKQTAEYTANIFEAFTLATVIYFVINMGFMKLMSRLEEKWRVPGMMGGSGK